VILSGDPNWRSWKQFFEVRNAADVPPDFLDERPGNEPLVMRDRLTEDR